MVGEEKRHQMMQNLFGDQSEEEEEEEEVESEHESNRQPDYASVRIFCHPLCFNLSLLDPTRLTGVFNGIAISVVTFC